MWNFDFNNFHRKYISESDLESTQYVIFSE